MPSLKNQQTKMSPQRRRLEVGGWEREQKMMCFITCVITVWSWPVEALKPPIRGSRSVMTPSGGQILLSASEHMCSSPSSVTFPPHSDTSHYPFHADQISPSRPGIPVDRHLRHQFSPLRIEKDSNTACLLADLGERKEKKKPFEYSVFVTQV